MYMYICTYLYLYLSIYLLIYIYIYMYVFQTKFHKHQLLDTPSKGNSLARFTVCRIKYVMNNIKNELKPSLTKNTAVLRYFIKY